MPSVRSIFLVLFVSSCVSSFVDAFPLTPSPTREDNIQAQSQIDSPSLVRRATASPTFPPSPPSCPICAQSFPGIDSCVQAAPAFSDISQIIFAPSKFVDLIKCACVDTFQSAFPQCVDCFQKTNQTALIDTSGDNIPSIISGLRSVCALASTLLGNVSGADGGQQVNGTPLAAPVNSGAIATKDPSWHLLPLNVAMAMLLAFMGSATL